MPTKKKVQQQISQCTLDTSTRYIVAHATYTNLQAHLILRYCAAIFIFLRAHDRVASAEELLDTGSAYSVTTRRLLDRRLQRLRAVTAVIF